MPRGDRGGKKKRPAPRPVPEAIRSVLLPPPPSRSKRPDDRAKGPRVTEQTLRREREAEGVRQLRKGGLGNETAVQKLARLILERPEESAVARDLRMGSLFGVHGPDPVPTAKNLLRQAKDVPAAIGPGLWGLAKGTALDLRDASQAIHHDVARVTHLGDPGSEGSLGFKRSVVPLAKDLEYLATPGPVVARLDEHGRTVYRRPDGGETYRADEAAHGYAAKMQERPLDYLLWGRGALMSAGRGAAMLRPELGQHGRLELTSRTGEKFSTASSSNPVRRAEQEGYRKLTTGLTGAIERKTGHELPVVGEHARAVRLGSKQLSRQQRAQRHRALAPFQAAFRGLHTPQQLAVVLHSMGVPPSRMVAFVERRLADARRDLRAAKGQPPAYRNKLKGEIHDHERQLKLLHRTSDELYDAVPTDPAMSAARAAAETLSNTGADILEVVGKLNPDIRDARRFLTARVVGGARFFSKSEARDRLAAIDEELSQINKAGAKLSRTASGLSDLRARLHADLGGPHDEAKARLYEIESLYESILGQMAGGYEAKNARSITAYRNSKAGVRARKGLPPYQTVKGEARRLAEAKLTEWLQRNDNPLAQRLNKELDEAYAIREALDAQVFEDAQQVLTDAYESYTEGGMTAADFASVQDEAMAVFKKHQAVLAASATLTKRYQRIEELANRHREVAARQEAIDAQYAAKQMEGHQLLESVGGFVGGPSLEQLKREIPDAIYFPHLGPKLREGAVPQRAAGRVEPRTPGIAKQNRGIRLLASRYLPDPRAWQDSYLKAVGYMHALERGELAYSVSKPLNAAGETNYGWWYVNLDGTKLTRAQTERAGFGRQMDEFILGDGDLEGFVNQNLASKSRDDALRWEAQGGRVAQISPSDYRNIFGEFQKSSVFVRNVIDRPTDFWRALTLTYRPAWVVNNFVGQTLLYAVNHSTPGGAKAYAQAVLDELKPEGSRPPLPGELAGLFESEASHSVGGPQLFAYTTSRAIRGERELRRNIQAFNAALSDNIPRRAAYYRIAQQHVDFLNRATGRSETLEHFLRELDAASHDPVHGDTRLIQLHEQIVQEVLDELIDFNDLSVFERRNVRRVVPFYTWLKGITKATGRLVMNRPLKAEFLAMAAQTFGEKELQKLFGIGQEVLGNIIPTSVKRSKFGREVAGISTVGLNPYQTVSDIVGYIPGLLSGDPNDARANPALATAPWFQGLVEAAMKSDLYTGKKIEQPQLAIPLTSYATSFPQFNAGKSVLQAFGVVDTPSRVAGNGRARLSVPGSATRIPGTNIMLPNEVWSYFGVPLRRKNIDRAQQIAWENRHRNVAREDREYRKDLNAAARDAKRFVPDKKLPREVVEDLLWRKRLNKAVHAAVHNDMTDAEKAEAKAQAIALIAAARYPDSADRIGAAFQASGKAGSKGYEEFYSEVYRDIFESWSRWNKEMNAANEELIVEAEKQKIPPVDMNAPAHLSSKPNPLNVAPVPDAPPKRPKR